MIYLVPVHPCLGMSLIRTTFFRHGSGAAIHVYRASATTGTSGLSAMFRYRFTNAILYVVTRR